jgi:hypothetical protein
MKPTFHHVENSNMAIAYHESGNQTHFLIEKFNSAHYFADLARTALFILCVIWLRDGVANV